VLHSLHERYNRDSLTFNLKSEIKEERSEKLVFKADLEEVSFYNGKLNRCKKGIKKIIEQQQLLQL